MFLLHGPFERQQRHEWQLQLTFTTLLAAHHAKGERGYFQPANFMLRNGRVVQVTYSSGPLGRLQAQHVLMLIDHFRTTEKR